MYPHVYVRTPLTSIVRSIDVRRASVSMAQHGDGTQSTHRDTIWMDLHRDTPLPVVRMQ